MTLGGREGVLGWCSGKISLTFRKDSYPIHYRKQILRRLGLENYAAVSLKKILHNPPTSHSSPSLIPANKTFLAAFFFSRKEKKTSSLFTMQLFNKVPEGASFQHANGLDKGFRDIVIETRNNRVTH